MNKTSSMLYTFTMLRQRVIHNKFFKVAVTSLICNLELCTDITRLPIYSIDCVHDAWFAYL